MGTRYNQIAGQSVERLAALSDGLFAVAMTLLVLDLKVPVTQGIETDGALLAALRDLAPRSCHLLDELPDPRHFLDRPADAA